MLCSPGSVASGEGMPKVTSSEAASPSPQAEAATSNPITAARLIDFFIGCAPSLVSFEPGFFRAGFLSNRLFSLGHSEKVLFHPGGENLVARLGDGDLLFEDEDADDFPGFGGRHEDRFQAHRHPGAEPDVLIGVVVPLDE